MQTQSNTDIFRILTVAPSLIQIEVLDAEKFKEAAHAFTIGSYLKISDEDNASIIALVQSYRIKEPSISPIIQENQSQGVATLSFILDAQPIGFLDKDGNFKRGGQQIAIPPNNVEIADVQLLKNIYNSINDNKKFVFSTLAQNPEVEIAVDGDKFFSKHIAVFGSTGSGKSGTVAKILQEGIKSTEKQQGSGLLNNSHILLFDLHGEYKPAFPKARTISIDNMVLPYWLMNSEELEELFIESSESNSHNQLSQFKTAVTLNKKRHNSTIPKVTYDTPVYFSIEEVYRYIYNQNVATKDAKTGVIKIKNPVQDVESIYQFFEEIEFEEKARDKVNAAPYHGEFERFIPRLETKINDERLSFLFKPKKTNGDEYKTNDLANILHQFICYSHKEEANISIIDLSGIPFEVLIAVS